MIFLFIGLGSAGQRHLKNINNLYPKATCYALKKNKLNKVIDHSNQKLLNQKIDEKFKVTFIKSSKEIKNIKPDFAIISNATSNHLDNVELLILMQCKIFIEKPISSNVSQINRLKKIKDIDRVIFIGYQYRFHPAIIEIKSLISKKSFGNLVSCNFYNGEYLPNMHKYENYKSGYAAKKKLGGGSLLTQIHEIDLAIFLFQKPDNVYAVGGKLSNLDIDVEDSVHILLNCKLKNNNLPVSIVLNFLSPLNKKIEILSDKFKVSFNFKDSHYLIKNNKTCKEKKFSFSFSRDQMFIDLIKSFVSKKKSKQLVNFTESLKSLDVAMKAKRIIKKNEK